MNRRILILSSSVLIGIIIGCCLFFSKKQTIDLWRVRYSFSTIEKENLPNYCTSDTLIFLNGFNVRNFTTSIADTLQQEGITRHDFKIYSTTSISEKELATTFSNVFGSIPATIIDIQQNGHYRRKEIILFSVLFFFTIGLIIEFFMSKKANSKKP